MSRLRAVAACSIGAVLLLLAAPALGSPGTVLLVSETLSEPGFVAEDEEPAISANGQFVAYVGETPDAEEPSSTGTGIYLRDMSGARRRSTSRTGTANRASTSAPWARRSRAAAAT